VLFRSILFFAISLPFFFGIVRRTCNESAAIFALIFYSFAPLSIAASRAFMPDMPSLALALGSLYFFWRWIDGATLRRTDDIPWGARASCPPAPTSCRRQDWRWKPVLPMRDLLIASLMIALSLLIKPTMVTIGAPFALLAWKKFGAKIFRQQSLWMFALIALAPSAIWYWHAHRIAEQFYPHHFFGAGGVRVMHPDWYWRILVLTFTSTLTPILFLLAAIGTGAVVAATARNVTPLLCWLAAMVAFIFVVGYGNRHQWYQLPLVPIASALGGAALNKLEWKRTAVTTSAMILFFAFSFFYSQHFFAPAAKSLWELGRALKEKTSPDALIIAADGGNPTALYYAHRKGWHFLERDGIYDGDPLDSAQIIADLEKLRSRGATHLVFYDGTIWWLQYYPEFTQHLTHTSRLVSTSINYRIYELKK